MEGRLSAPEAGARGLAGRWPWPVRWLAAYCVVGVVVVLVVDLLAVVWQGGSMFNTYLMWQALLTQPSPNPRWLVVLNLVMLFATAVLTWPYHLYMFIAGIKFFERG